MKLIQFALCVFGYFAIIACSGTAVSDGCSSSHVGGTGSNQCSTATGGSTTTIQDQGNVKSIVAGDQVACALLKDSTIKCWGHNSVGQLGNGSLINSATPVAVSGISNAVSIGSVGWSTCAILSDATVKCWGQNDYRQLGSSVTSPSTTPVAVPNVSNATSVAVGWNHACALINDGTVKCWGRCSEKQCGSATSSASAPPTTMNDVSGVKAISAYDYHTCVLLQDGTVKCCGQTNLGSAEVNQGLTVVTDASQQAISGMTMITSGKWFNIAANASGVYAWGNGLTGTLGDGQMASRSAAAPVSGIANPVAIGSGYLSACAVLQGGTVKCWGENSNGMMGVDSSSSGTEFVSSPRLVPGLSNVAQIAVGQSTICVLVNGNVYCMGSNYNGELGNGGTADSITPVKVINL